MQRCFYTLLIYLALPFTPLKLLWRGIKQREYLNHWAERYGFYTQAVTKPVIWLHCVSVGETRAVAPLVQALQAQYPHHQILLTHATPTGRATGEQLFADSVLRCYLPYDAPCLVRRFIHHFKPVVGVLMETELWFNLIAACHAQQVPLLLLNARLSARSAKGYARVGSLMRQGLQQLSAIAAQTAQDAQRFEAFNAPNVSVMGNLKFDVTPPEDAMQRGEYLRTLLGKDRPVLLAASTREGEEAMILDAVAAANIPNLLTVMVPRHPQRFDEVAHLLAKRGLSFCRRSEFAMGSVAADIPTNAVVLGDSMGEMFTYYAACDVALIGGSLQALGGQNLLEAFAMGKPVLVGPHTFNFVEATDQAVAVCAAWRVQDVASLSQVLADLMQNPQKQADMGKAGLALMARSKGAVNQALSAVAKAIESSAT